MKNFHHSSTPKIHYSFLRDPRGYTLVETLVASAILLSVLIPATLILGKLTLGQYHQVLIVATQLAREEMERTIAEARYQDEEKHVALGSKSWRLVRDVQEQSGLLEIRIRVFKLRQAKPLVEIKTLRVVKSQFGMPESYGIRLLVSGFSESSGCHPAVAGSFFKPAFSPTREFIRQVTLPCHPEGILFNLEHGA